MPQLAFLIGLVAGMRTMAAPTAAVWVVSPGPWAWGLTVLALGELAIDLHPKTPHRTDAALLVARLTSGAVSGGLIGAWSGILVAGAVAGLAGAAAGTFGGHLLRARLAAAFGRDWPAALIEDALALGLAVLVWRVIRG
jgi:uncharacterized membrane protein